MGLITGLEEGTSDYEDAIDVLGRILA